MLDVGCWMLVLFNKLNNILEELCIFPSYSMFQIFRRCKSQKRHLLFYRLEINLWIGFSFEQNEIISLTSSGSTRNDVQSLKQLNYLQKNDHLRSSKGCPDLTTRGNG